MSKRKGINFRKNSFAHPFFKPNIHGPICPYLDFFGFFVLIFQLDISFRDISSGFLSDQVRPGQGPRPVPGGRPVRAGHGPWKWTGCCSQL